jgi:hypothetical protein
LSERWRVLFHPRFAAEYRDFETSVRRELAAMVQLLEANGPHLGRPYADTLKASRHGNMKELRFTAGSGVWRAAFAFDPERQAIVLVAGDKQGRRGGAEARFYKRLIDTADRRLDEPLRAMRGT